MKSGPRLCSLWVDKWKFQFQYQEATRIVETPRELSRSPEKPREAERSLEKPREAMRKHEKPLEASRRTKETRESSTGGFSGHFEFREGSLSALLFVCLPPAPQKIMVEVLRNQTEVKQVASSTLLDFIVTPIQFQMSLTVVLDWIQYTIYIYIT